MKFHQRFWFGCLLLVVSDLILTRDLSFLANNIFSGRFLVNYFVSTFASFSLLYLIISSRIAIWTKFFLFCFCFVFPMFMQLNHFGVYREFLSPFGFSFFFNNLALTLQFSNDHVNWGRTLVAVICFLYAFAVIVKSSPAPTLAQILSTRRSLILKTAHSVFYLGMVGVCAYAWFSVREFQNSSVSFAATSVEFASRKTGVYHVDKPQLPPSKLPENAPSIVWIVGESVVRNHMGLYGYSRDTTPNLDAMNRNNELIAFRNAIAVGNKTMLSVPYMLFGLEGPDPEGRIYRSPSVFDYAKSAGYRTAFISAQETRWYNLDKLIIDENVDVYKPGPHFSPNVTVSKGADDGTVLREGVFPYLQSETKPFLLVYQMDGSHYPYSAHSPQEHKKFLPEEEPNSLNSYDNTIVYLDVVMRQLVEEVRRVQPTAWIFFSTDHGQNLGEKKYNSDYSLDVIHNAFLIIPPKIGSESPNAESPNSESPNSDSLKQRLERLRQNIDSPVSQVDLMATALELFQVKELGQPNGYSLFGNIPDDRMRIASAYMPTFENEPSAVLVTPDLKQLTVHFDRKTASWWGKPAFPLSEVDPELMKHLKPRATAK